MTIETTQFRPAQAAAYLGIAHSTLAKLRVKGTGPKFHKPLSKVIIYYRADLDDWINQNSFRSTSEYKNNRF